MASRSHGASGVQLGETFGWPMLHLRDWAAAAAIGPAPDPAL
ncbi:MAG: hypothetical protein OJF58_002552 [Enhydrobacter sp.]|nr:MAG: hypothetical protein OJF58_002552 [Enhydrobacter sp.]